MKHVGLQVNCRIIIQLRFSTALALCLLAPVTLCQDTQSTSPNTSVDRPLNMLVLGDSIMWGQGLRTEHKSWYQIKIWLAQNTGRAVSERIEAHAGAVIEVAGTEVDSLSVDGEVKVSVPSVINQVDRALRNYLDGTHVDLVLVSGCINDVGTTNLLNAANTPEEIRLLTEAKCGPTMERLLRRITSSFPTAYVIVTGYYPFVSKKTRRDLFTRGFMKGFYQAVPGASSLSQESIFKRLIANSDEWYGSSNKSLSEAVRRVNAEFNGTKYQGRVMFAEIPFLPEHSFRAPKTQLWNFESSLFRKLLVMLSVGKILPRTNDEMRKQRATSCKESWWPLPNETPSQKKEKKKQELLCRYGALGHPNRKGALTYAEAIKDQLKTVYPVLGSR
ncbi:MAG: SGNH/GDSL hydrolase family protein [Pyrinomonadaceae bacterium]|nr:SGNH/GDSL hydrolase family protein [Pyrinomonadaceae bacterium]